MINLLANIIKTNNILAQVRSEYILKQTIFTLNNFNILKNFVKVLGKTWLLYRICVRKES